MNKRQYLSADAKNWVADNLARGCSVTAIVQDMVRMRYDESFATSVVLQMQSAHPMGADPFPATRPTPAAKSASARPVGYAYGSPRMPQGNCIRTHDREVRVVTRVAQPQVAVLDGVLSEAECQILITRSLHKLQASRVVDPTSGTFADHPDRTSEGTYFERCEDDFIAGLDRRISEIMGIPLENGEGLQVLHYAPGGEYKPHWDFFPPDNPGSAAALATGGQRVATMVMYLNTVHVGGSTLFPKIGLEIIPKPGSAVCFEYVNASGQLDESTLHAGAPVISGEKWIVTKWMRESPYSIGAA
ncbi:MAG: 2OG-Fe(II) oxygenase [Rhodanobacter sp.]